ncbi:5-methylcytosine restriction system specificity protein McrC, partial [Escherichia coli]|uniref:5-methylcytosine restriction system specificity protein McrC n=2 Tax=Enterobacteriaceae TaxID=543 RepID=UPI003BA37E63
GKLRISAQLTKNCVRKDRFQVEFDEYNVERPENCILKTALAKVYRQTRHPQLLQQLRPLQAHFEDIPSINDVRVAFDQVRL